MKNAKLWKGFIGPVGTSNDIKMIFDKSIDLDASYVVGGNKKDTHTEGFNPRRDIKDIAIADLRLSREGDLTLDGKYKVIEKRGIEVGHVFQLGDKYTKDMKVGVLDQNGKLVTPLMGCYGIGVTRVVAAAIEQNHDENGIVWPKSIAPYQIYFATIVKAEEFIKIADEIYTEMLNAGLEVVYDDRNVGPGNKFKDSDLLGLPYRVVLGERDFGASGELEVIERKTGTIIKVKRTELVQQLKNLLK
jgi:prolyl-tRNA synthetase